MVPDLERGVEVQVNGIVQLRTEFEAGSVVQMGWVAVGRPAEILLAHKT